MPNGQEITAVNKKTGQRIRWDGKAWVPIVEPEGTLKKAGRGAALGTFAGAGIPETQTPITDLAKSFVTPSPSGVPILDMLDPTGGALKQVVGIGKNLGTTGVDVLKDIGKVDPRVGGEPGQFDAEKTSHDVASLITQILLLRGGKKAAETPLAESEVVRGGKAVVEAPRSTLQQAIVSKAEIERARVEHEAEIQQINEAYEKKVQEVGRKTAADESVRQLAIEQAKDKYAAKLSEHMEKIREASAKQTAGEVKSKTFTQPRSGPVYQRLAIMVDKVATEDVPALDKAVRTAYDSRWGAWRQAMGDAEGNFTPVMEAVQEAEDTILKGSPENIGIFRNILAEGDNPILAQASVFKGGVGIDVKDILGSRYMSEVTRNRVLRSLEEAGVSETGRMPLTETSLPIDDIRGYITELQQKMFGGRFTGDVYRALKHVQQAAESEVQRVAKERGQLDVYNRLKSDWSQYLGDFYDSDGALTKLKNSGTSDARLTLVSGSQGANIVEALGRYARFLPKAGETAIDTAGKVRSIIKQLREMPTSAKIPALPERPSFPPPKPPRELPERPETKLFSSEGFRREKIQRTAENLSHITGWDVASVGYALRELFTGHAPWALGYPVGKRLLARLLANPRVIEYLSREGPQ
jgi:hypothetical protein